MEIALLGKPNVGVGYLRTKCPHTDPGDNFIRAIDGRSKRILGCDYVLKEGDVIKIVAGR